ncbi:MAG: GNAT family N-acetyltransferase [Bacillota bacterium]
MWNIEGRKVKIRKMLREDIDKMQQWGRHSDPLFFHYNFPMLTKKEGDFWYKTKAKLVQKKSYVIENEDGKIVGYLSIRNIKWFRGESELGIVLDPDEMNKGYGQDAIKTFLAYYFRDLGMKVLHLRVAIFNQRASTCYQRCGFEMVCEEELEFEDQDTEILRKDVHRDLHHLFTIRDGKIWATYKRMWITKEKFLEQANRVSTKTTVNC